MIYYYLKYVVILTCDNSKELISRIFPICTPRIFGTQHFLIVPLTIMIYCPKINNFIPHLNTFFV